MTGFEHTTPNVRVVFGIGAADRLAGAIADLDLRSVMVCASARWAGRADALMTALGARGAFLFDAITPQVPIETLETLRARAREAGVDGIVSIGGGAPLGFAKGTALGLENPTVIAVVTTYSGSELTPMQGITRDGVKRTASDPRMQPRLVVYDPELSRDLPPRIAGPSGMNAMAHAVEALYGGPRDPIAIVDAEAAASRLWSALPRIAEHPDDLAARTEALLGAYFAGRAVAATGVGVHHRACHVLGATYGIGHGDANAVMLPQALACNAGHAPDAVARLSAIFASAAPAAALFDFAARIGAPRALRDLGFDPANIARASELTLDSTNQNPRPMAADWVARMFQAAHEGQRPQQA